jgi:glycosyltransferase involved in cell wall biosynthesis
MEINKTIYLSTYDDIKNPNYGGGGAVAVHEVAKRLSKNYNVRILSWDYSGKKQEAIDGVLYERFGFPFLSPKVAMFVYQIALPFVARRKNFDLWLESFCPPFTTSFFPLICNKPVVGMVHMLAAEDMERKYKLPFHVVQNAGMRLYKHIIVTTEQLKNQVQFITPKSQVIVISNGIPNVFKPITKKQNYILFLGRIEVDQKGIDLLFDAFSIFQLKQNAYKLILAGSGTPEEEKKMQKLFTKTNLSNSVQIVGKVEGIEKEKLLRNAACIVIPSRFETYSLVALEAMAYGCLIVCFAINGLSWIPKNAAKKIKPFEKNAMAEAINQIVTNKVEMQSIVTIANAYAKQFTWDEIGRNYNLYVKQVFQKQ